MTSKSDGIPDEFAKSWNPKEDCYGAVEPASIKPAVVDGLPDACWYILIVELCERLTFYTFNGTISFFLERVGFSLVKAGGLNASMVSLCYCWPILASWVADVKWGRYKTILFAGIVYVVGAAASGVAAWPAHESIGLYFLGMLVLIPMGTAGIKSNLSNLGADQYDESDPRGAMAQERFFSIFYLSINVGSLVAFGFMTTFATNGGMGIPRLYGYSVSYGLGACSMAIAVVIFFLGSDRYRKVPLQEQSAIIYAARSLLSYSRAGSLQASSICLGSMLLLGSIALSVVQAFVENSHLSHGLVTVGFAFAIGGLLALVVPCLNTEWLGFADGSGTHEVHPPSRTPAILGMSIADLKGFLELLPPLTLGTIAFNALYNCMSFWFQQQACQMDLRLTPSVQLSGSFFNVADCMAIVLLTPLIVDWLNPLLAQKANCQLSCVTKFGIGMAFGCASIVLAALLELQRRGIPLLDVPSQCAPEGVKMSDIRAMWMLFPYFLMGLGEIYCNPTLMHYAYNKSPPSMRTLAVAVSFFLQAVSSAVFALFLERLKVFVPNDLNRGHLEYGYFLSILVGLLFYALFVKVLGH